MTEQQLTAAPAINTFFKRVSVDARKHEIASKAKSQLWAGKRSRYFWEVSDLCSGLSAWFICRPSRRTDARQVLACMKHCKNKLMTTRCRHWRHPITVSPCSLMGPFQTWCALGLHARMPIVRSIWRQQSHVGPNVYHHAFGVAGSRPVSAVTNRRSLTPPSYRSLKITGKAPIKNRQPTAFCPDLQARPWKLSNKSSVRRMFLSSSHATPAMQKR